MEETTRLLTLAVKELCFILDACPQRSIYMVVTTFQYAIAHTDHPAGTPETAPEDYTMLSWNDLCRLQQPERDYAGIMQCMHALVKQYPRNAWARCLRARALWVGHRYAQAIDDLSYALHIFPQMKMALALLGESYYLAGDYTQALRVLNTAIDHYRDSYRFYIGRSIVYRALAHTAERTQQPLWLTAALRDLEIAATLPHAPETNAALSTTAHSIEQQLQHC